MWICKARSRLMLCLSRSWFRCFDLYSSYASFLGLEATRHPRWRIEERKPVVGPVQGEGSVCGRTCDLVSACLKFGRLF